MVCGVSFCVLYFIVTAFRLVEIKSLAKAKEDFSLFLSRPYILPFLFIPLMLLFYKYYIDYPEQASLLDDWMLFLFSLTMLLYGFFMGSVRAFWLNCEKYRRFFLGIAGVCMVALFFGYWWQIALPKQQDERLYMYGFLNSLNIWMIVLAACGYAKKYLNFTNSFLKTANKAVYSILHYTPDCNSCSCILPGSA
jgi:hypothetical protein